MNSQISVLKQTADELKTNIKEVPKRVAALQAELKEVSPQQAIVIADQNNASIQYDQTAQAPFFRYTDAENRRHEVWFEDARSIQAKFNLIKELNLRGISYWKLGLSFPQNWLLLSDQFNVVNINKK